MKKNTELRIIRRNDNNNNNCNNYNKIKSLDPNRTTIGVPCDNVLWGSGIDNRKWWPMIDLTDVAMRWDDAAVCTPASAADTPAAVPEQNTLQPLASHQRVTRARCQNRLPELSGVARSYPERITGVPPEWPEFHTAVVMVTASKHREVVDASYACIYVCILIYGRLWSVTYFITSLMNNIVSGEFIIYEVWQAWRCVSLWYI